MRWQDYVEQNPKVMMGKYVIKGTRLTVQMILEKLGKGADEKELLAAHPRLTVEAIRAAQLFAADYVGMENTIWDQDVAG